MAEKNLTTNRKFNALKKLFDAGYKTEKDLQNINIQTIFNIEGLTIQEMSIISEIQVYVKSNKLYSYLGGVLDEHNDE